MFSLDFFLDCCNIIRFLTVIHRTAEIITIFGINFKNFIFFTSCDADYVQLYLRCCGKSKS